MSCRFFRCFVFTLQSALSSNLRMPSQHHKRTYWTVWPSPASCIQRRWRAIQSLGCVIGRYLRPWGFDPLISMRRGLLLINTRPFSYRLHPLCPEPSGCILEQDIFPLAESLGVEDPPPYDYTACVNFSGPRRAAVVAGRYGPGNIRRNLSTTLRLLSGSHCCVEKVHLGGERFLERRSILGRKAALLTRKVPVIEGFQGNPVPHGNASAEYLYFPSDLPI